MNVSQNFKTLIKKIKQQDLKLTIKDGELTVGEIHLMPVKIFNAMSIKFPCCVSGTKTGPMSRNHDNTTFLGTLCLLGQRGKADVAYVCGATAPYRCGLSL